MTSQYIEAKIRSEPKKCARGGYGHGRRSPPSIRPGSRHDRGVRGARGAAVLFEHPPVLARQCAHRVLAWRHPSSGRTVLPPPFRCIVCSRGGAAPPCSRRGDYSVLPELYHTGAAPSPAHLPACSACTSPSTAAFRLRAIKKKKNRASSTLSRAGPASYVTNLV